MCQAAAVPSNSCGRAKVASRVQSKLDAVRIMRHGTLACDAAHWIRLEGHAQQVALAGDALLTAANHAISAQATTAMATGSEGDVESGDEEQGASTSLTFFFLKPSHCW